MIARSDDIGGIVDHQYIPLIVNTSRSFPCSWLITGFVTRLTRRVSLVKQELPTLPEHLSSPPVVSGVCVTRSLVLYVFFVDRCFVLFSCGHCVVLLFTDSDYPFGILWPLCCLSFYLQILITRLVSCGHCVVCLSIYGFWLPVWYLVAIVLSVLLFTDSDYPFGILWPLCCLSFYLQILITRLVSSNSSYYEQF